MWDYYSNGSWWVCTDAAICVPPEINTEFVTTPLTTDVDSPITLYLSVKGSACLFSVNECVVCTRSTYRELFIPYSYSQQLDMFHPSVDGVFRLICHRFLISTFPNWSGQ